MQQSPPRKTRRKNTSKLGSVKITLTIPELLLGDVDNTAKLDYTTRSDVIRQALVDYIRQYKRACGEMEPEEALKVLKRRLGMAYFNKTLKETKFDAN
jgi:metal-responsive CopG/Arc/MetJ family transcriptional regulator